MSEQKNTLEPFGYFRAETFGWTDCAETDEGAIPLYDQSAIDALKLACDELLSALKGLHKVCEIALSGINGRQYTYFETRAGHFVEAKKAMQSAEFAIASAKDQSTAATNIIDAPATANYPQVFLVESVELEGNNL